MQDKAKMIIFCEFMSICEMMAPCHAYDKHRT